MATSSASLDRSPRKNWVENSGGLPPGIRKVARKLKQLYPSWSLQRAIKTAISRSKAWAAGGSAKGARNVAGWEALRGRNAARMGKTVSASNPALDGMVLLLSQSYGADTAPPMSLAQAAEDLAAWLELAEPAEVGEWLELAEPKKAAKKNVRPKMDATTAETVRLVEQRNKEKGKASSWDEAAHPRAAAGSPTGGEFVPAGKARDEKAAEAQKDKEAAGNSAKLQKGALTPGKLSDDQLQKLSRYLFSWKSSDPKVVAARVKAVGELRKRGMDPGKFGSLAGKTGKATPRARRARKPRTVAAAEPADDVAWLDLATERRVRTPAGVKRYGKPIGAVITAGSAPKVRRGADYVRAALKSRATREQRAGEAAQRLAGLDSATRRGVLQNASNAQLAQVERAAKGRSAVGQPGHTDVARDIATERKRRASAQDEARKVRRGETKLPGVGGSSAAADADRLTAMTPPQRMAAVKELSTDQLDAVHREMRARYDAETLDHRKAAAHARMTTVAVELKRRGEIPGKSPAERREEAERAARTGDALNPTDQTAARARAEAKRAAIRTGGKKPASPDQMSDADLDAALAESKVQLRAAFDKDRSRTAPEFVAAEQHATALATEKRRRNVANGAKPVPLSPAERAKARLAEQQKHSAESAQRRAAAPPKPAPAPPPTPPAPAPAPEKRADDATIDDLIRTVRPGGAEASQEAIRALSDADLNAAVARMKARAGGAANTEVRYLDHALRNEQRRRQAPAPVTAKGAEEWLSGEGESPRVARAFGAYYVANAQGMPLPAAKRRFDSDPNARDFYERPAGSAAPSTPAPAERPQPDMSNPEKLSDGDLSSRLSAAETRLRQAKEASPRRTGQAYADAKLNRDVLAAEQRRRDNAAAHARTGNTLPGERPPGAPTPTRAGQPFPTGPREADNVAPGMVIDTGDERVTIDHVKRDRQSGTVDLVDTTGKTHTYGTGERARVVGGVRPGGEPTPPAPPRRDPTMPSLESVPAGPRRERVAELLGGYNGEQRDQAAQTRAVNAARARIVRTDDDEELRQAAADLAAMRTATGQNAPKEMRRLNVHIGNLSEEIRAELEDRERQGGSGRQHLNRALADAYAKAQTADEDTLTRMPDAEFQAVKFEHARRAGAGIGQRPDPTLGARLERAEARRSAGGADALLGMGSAAEQRAAVGRMSVQELRAVDDELTRRGSVSGARRAVAEALFTKVQDLRPRQALEADERKQGTRRTAALDVGAAINARAQDPRAVSGTPENIAARQQARARGAAQPSMFAGEEDQRMTDVAVRRQAAGTLFDEEPNDEAAAVAEMSPRTTGARTATTRAAQAELERAQAATPDLPAHLDVKQREQLTRQRAAADKAWADARKVFDETEGATDAATKRRRNRAAQKAADARDLYDQTAEAYGAPKLPPLQRTARPAGPKPRGDEAAISEAKRALAEVSRKSAANFNARGGTLGGKQASRISNGRLRRAAAYGRQTDQLKARLRALGVPDDEIQQTMNAAWGG